MRTTGIGIIGAGVAGLHLGLRLLRQGVPVTLYAERTPEQLRAGRLLNTVAHHPPTREQERALGVNHWDGAGCGVYRIVFRVAGSQPLSFAADMEQPSLFIDHRLYLAQLIEDFALRGGRVVFGRVDVAAAAHLVHAHALLVVASGRAGLAGLFEPMEAHSPFTAPQRRLLACLVRGVRFPTPLGLAFNVVPGQGELFEAQMLTRHGPVTSLLVEAIPGGALEAVTTTSYDEDPAGFERRLLSLLQEYAPDTARRVDPDAFGVLDPLDLMQGEVTPVVRRGYAPLGEGHLALALGDARVLNDPISGQGANLAAATAWVVGTLILEALEEGQPFDEPFLRRVEASTWEVSRSYTEWTNALLRPPPPHLVELMVAASRDRALAQAFLQTFTHPPQAAVLATNPEAAAAFIAQHGRVQRGTA